MDKFVLGLILLTIISCKEVTFKIPQPKSTKALASVPENLHGKYLAIDKNGAISKDTLIITEKGYHLSYLQTKKQFSGKHNLDNGVLGDAIILKSFKGYYFLNINQEPEWILRILKQEETGDIILMTPNNEEMEFNEYLKKLSSEIKISSVERNGETLYQIDPSPKKLIDLIDKGYFSETALKKIM
jgi:hypothetical protein